MDTTVHRALEDVVIVGGGIAGMATALALHRLGVKSIVLEKSPTLRASGTSLLVWTNGWQALEELGVAGPLRDKSTSVSRMDFHTNEGKLLASFSTENEKRHVECQAVERRLLLETLVEPLPVGTIHLNCNVVNIHKIEGGYTQVELQNGATIQTKILLGCDGVGSVVARYLGLEPPDYTGYIGFRGMGVFPEGHGFSNVLKSIIGQAVRVGYYPLDSTRAYWFVLSNEPQGKRITSPEAMKEEALRVVEAFPQVVIDLISRAPLETLNLASVSCRWMWPFTGPKFCRGGVSVAGDAMHPVRPILGQGGNFALEDGVILGRLLSQALKGSNGSLKGKEEVPEMKRIEVALSCFTNTRQARLFAPAIVAHGIDSLAAMERGLMLRDMLFPTLLTQGNFTRHTFYDCRTSP